MDTLPSLTPTPAPAPGPPPTSRRPRRWVTAALIPAIVGGGVAFGVTQLTDGGGNTRTVTVAQGANPEPTPTATTTTAPPAAANPGGGTLNIQDIVKAASPGVVLVEQGQGLGTGFLIDAAGHILTNAHVVDTATTVDVTYEDGTKVSAKVLAADESIDLAVLDAGAPPSSAKVLQLGSSKSLQVGDPVVAIGNPLDQGHTVTSGIVSALKRTICSPNKNTIANAIQTDAAINPGNSGGPLLNDRAQVVGINSQILSQGGGNEGIGFAVPSDIVRPVADGVIAGGKPRHAWIGIVGEALTPDVAKQIGAPGVRGVVLRSIEPRGPAKAADLISSPALEKDPPKGGDIIVAINGAPVNDFGDLTEEISSRKVGETIDLTVLRAGKRVTVKLTLADRPADLGGGCRQ